MQHCTVTTKELIFENVEIPEEHTKSKLNEYREKLVEAVAELDEDLMDEIP